MSWLRSTSYRAVLAGCLVFVLFPYAAANAENHAGCGYERVNVVGSAQEQALACKAVDEILAYFKSIGFQIEPKCRMIFSDRVYVNVYEVDPRHTMGQMQVSGYYDPSRDLIEVTSALSRYRKGRKPWKIAWGAAVAYSIMQHELAHMAVRHALGPRYGEYSKAWLEYIASAVQFDLMKPALRNRIMANMTEARPFERPEHVNALLHGFDPDLFAASAYVDAKSRGGKVFLKRLLLGEVPFTIGEILWSK